MSALVERLERSAIALSLLIGVALVPACQKASPQTATPAQAGEADSAKAAPDPLAELEHLEGRMRELGMPAATPDRKRSDASAKVEEKQNEESLADEQPRPSEPSPAGAATERDFSDSRCATVCALNEQICELEVQICSMAKDHDSEPIYSNACERAVDDCELSGDACDTCVE